MPTSERTGMAPGRADIEREIENYLHPDAIQEGIGASLHSATQMTFLLSSVLR